MKVLLAIDDSTFSEAATRALVTQVKPNGTEVRVLHVIEPMTIGGEIYVRDWQEVAQQLKRRAETLVAQTAEVLGTAGFRVERVLEEGDVKLLISDYAAKWQADLIVMGSHGRTGLSRFLLGSVSEAIVRHARCSVEIVRVPSN